MEKISAKRAGVALQDALKAEGIKDFGYYGSLVRGWVPANHCNSLELGIKPREKGGIYWFIEVETEGVVQFSKYENDDDRYAPQNPEAMHSIFEAAFARLGLEVMALTLEGWSDQSTMIRYRVWTPHPEWLEPYDETNRQRYPHNGTLVSVKFSAPWSYPGKLPAYVMKDGEIRLPRASIDALASYRQHNGRPIIHGEIDEMNWAFFQAANGRRGASMGSDCRKITDFWGNQVETWRGPSGIMSIEDRFAIDIPYDIGGEDASNVEVEAQFGSWPWNAAGVAPSP